MVRCLRKRSAEALASGGGFLSPRHSVWTVASSLSALRLWVKEVRRARKGDERRTHRNSPRMLALMVMMGEMVLRRSATVRREMRGGRIMLT